MAEYGYRQKKNSFYSGKNQLLLFEIQSFGFCIGLRTLELAHHVGGNHFILINFIDNLMCFNWYLK